MKLTIDQLKNYLGTGLKIEHAHREFKLIASFDGIKSSEEVIEFVGHDEKFEGRCILIKINNSSDAIKLSETYPICYRLSDLDKFIPELGVVPLIKMVQECHCGDPNEDWFCGEAIRSRSHRKVYNIGYGDIKWEIELGYPPALRFDYYQKLFQWHFWPFGDEYFESGLVIDKLLYNTTTH